jgi:hypothetical protein
LVPQAELYYNLHNCFYQAAALLTDSISFLFTGSSINQLQQFQCTTGIVGA